MGNLPGIVYDSHMRFLAVLTLVASAAAQTIGMNSWIHATANLDRTARFYVQAFGLDFPEPPGPRISAVVPALVNAPGAETIRSPC